MRALIVSAALVLFATPQPAAAVGGGPDDAAERDFGGLAYVPDEVLLQFRPNAGAAEKARARGRVSAVAKERIETAALRAAGRGDLELASLPAGTDVLEAIRELNGEPALEFAEPNWIYRHSATADDPYYTNGSLWGMYGDASSPANAFGSQAAEAWASNHTGARTVFVGVIDEGIQVTHPDLAGNIWTNPFDPPDGVDNDGNGFVDDVNGWDFVGNDASVYDGGKSGKADAHGTHVAGTIGAIGGNGAGVAGVNWAVTIISAKFLGRGGGTTANAVRAVDYLTDLKHRHGIDLVASNNSWGGGGYSKALYDAIERARVEGILFVAAAGNGGFDGVGDDLDRTPSYPASYPNANIIAVAAISRTGGLASFSNYGLNSVDLGAPGVGVYSTLPVNKYGSYSGTSMATPHVTGAAALYAATHSDRGAALKAAILGSALSTASLAGKCVTGGRLNAGGF